KTADEDEDEKSTTTTKAKVTSTAKSKGKTTSVEDEEETTTKAKTKSKTKTKETEVESETTKSTKTRSKTTATDEATTSVPSAISVPTATNTESVLFKASGQASMSTTLETSNINTATSALSSSSASAAASSSSGDSGPGTKAGIAFGVLGGIFIVGMLVFFVFSRRRKQADRQRLEEDDEKLNGPIGPARVASPVNPVGPSDAHLGVAAAVSNTPRTDPKAPRISLRPVTQFLPNWNLEKRTSKGAAMALAAPAAGGAVASRVPGGSAWDRPTTAQSSDPSNPFGVQAERVATPIMEESISARSTSPNHDATRAVSPVSSIGTINTTNDPLTAHGPQVAVAVAAATTAGSATLARKTSMRNNGPKKLDLTLPNLPLSAVPPSPAGTEFSINSAAPGAPEAPSHSAAAIAAAGGPVNSSVHRVQLDFNPTMDDELEMKAGDLVRLLHEYDDGWALCIRLDRSRQGVVPRTCLSTRPVKPRPAQGGPRPGPRGPMGPPGQRPMTPQGMQAQGRPASPAGRPMTPNGGGNQSPLGPPMNPVGRPMSPAHGPQSPGPRQGPPAARSMSPGPRSQSPAPRRGSPPGPSPMNPAQEPRRGPPTGPVGRKPVPGQAY
ncbi:hypothetical protein EDB81DRAFT_640898, partial [Dactylonectria macrodidyma]